MKKRDGCSIFRWSESRPSAHSLQGKNTKSNKTSFVHSWIQMRICQHLSGWHLFFAVAALLALFFHNNTDINQPLTSNSQGLVIVSTNDNPLFLSCLVKVSLAVSQYWLQTFLDEFTPWPLVPETSRVETLELFYVWKHAMSQTFSHCKIIAWTKVKYWLRKWWMYLSNRRVNCCYIEERGRFPLRIALRDLWHIARSIGDSHTREIVI